MPPEQKIKDQPDLNVNKEVDNNPLAFIKGEEFKDREIAGEETLISDHEKIDNNPLTFVKGGKFDDTEEAEDIVPQTEVAITSVKPVDTKKEISNLENEIARIVLADSKAKYAKLWGIPKEAVGEDISMAGLSISEREDKIKVLKKSRPSIAQRLKKAAKSLNTLLGF